MKIGLNPNYRVNLGPSDLRGDLYAAIASSRDGTIKLKFNDNNAVVGMISGFVSKLEAPLFSPTAEVTLTMECEDPIFRSEYVTSALLTDTDLIGTAAFILVDPISTFPHGFKFKLTFTGSVNPFIIEDNLTDPEWRFQINYPFISGDELYFSSEVNDKYLYRVRSAATIQLMDVIEPGSIWPIIFRGENLFEVEGSTFDWDEIYWYETHWGV